MLMRIILVLQNEKYYNCNVIDDNNNEYKINCKQLYNNDYNNFENWVCNAGLDRISIENDMVWGGECHNDFLGTIDNWQLLDSPTICKRNKCTACSQDLIIKKEIIDRPLINDIITL